MSLLGFDTSGEICSVALWHDAEMRAYEAPGGAQASQHLLPLIAQALASAGLRLHQLQGLVVGIGPGAFTGVRTAVSVAQGLALGSGGLAVWPVNSLEALGWQASNNTEGCAAVALDARLQEVYFAAYEWYEGQKHIRVPPSVASWSVAQAQCAAHQAVLNALTVPGALAPLMVRYTLQLQASGVSCWQSAADVEPLYVRNKVAFTTAERAGHVS